ncbi:MAG TPA: ribose-5-phosphate isomerase RpiA [Thermoleophilaceae bacterium]|nr:ribose-5-phosphate isomerase RpiA [Thermoleophilaceae bacterium]
MTDPELAATRAAASRSDEAARTAAAMAAAELVSSGMIIGLGSGRAVWKVVELLGERFGVAGGAAGVEAGVPAPRGPLRAVAASSRTAELARAVGIDVVELDGRLELDLALDGADEVDDSLRLIKGGGGALLREKIVVSAAREFVVVAETGKRVERLGERFRLPVEVVRFAWRDTRRRLSALLPNPALRIGPDGEPYLTDEAHYILDCALPGDADLDLLDHVLKHVPGVVEHGLFIGLASRALLGRPDGGVEVLERPAG